MSDHCMRCGDVLAKVCCRCVSIQSKGSTAPVCADCEHNLPIMACGRVEWKDLVTGEVRCAPCRHVRSAVGGCGPTGEWFSKAK